MWLPYARITTDFATQGKASRFSTLQHMRTGPPSSVDGRQKHDVFSTQGVADLRSTGHKIRNFTTITMAKLALIIPLLGLSLAAHAQAGYDSWDGVKPTVAAARAVSSSDSDAIRKSAETELRKLPAAGRTVSATYVGTAKASFAFTAPLPRSESIPPYATYTGQARATGVANFKASANSKGASFTGTLSNWVADAGTDVQPPGFNKRAVGILRDKVHLSGKIGEKSETVSGEQERSLSGAGSNTASASSGVGARKKDYLPETLDGNITLRNARDYWTGSKRHRTEVRYEWTTKRK